MAITWAKETGSETIGGSYSNQFITQTNPVRVVESSKLASVACNCVLWAKYYLGRENEYWGYPRDIPVKKSGDVVVTRESAPSTNTGHTAVIIDRNETTLFLLEANYKPCEVSTRSLDIDSSLIRGYY